MHYVYRITNLKENKHYIGVRITNKKYSENLLEDLKKYKTSSKELHKLLKEEPLDNFKFKIVKTFNNRGEAKDYEKKYIKKVQAHKKDNFYNKSLNEAGHIYDLKDYNFNNKRFDAYEILYLDKRQKFNEKEKLSNPFLVASSTKYIYFTNNTYFFNKFQLLNHLKIKQEYKHKDYYIDLEVNKITKEWIIENKDRIFGIKDLTVEELEEKLNEILVKKYHNEMSKKRNGLKNSIGIYKNKEQKYILSEYLDKFLEMGWKIGNIKTLGVNKKGKMEWINKDGVNKRVPKEEVENYIKQGWNKGRYYKDKKDIPGVFGNKIVNRIIDLRTGEYIPSMKKEDLKPYHKKTNNKEVYIYDNLIFLAQKEIKKYCEIRGLVKYKTYKLAQKEDITKVNKKYKFFYKEYNYYNIDF